MIVTHYSIFISLLAMFAYKNYRFYVIKLLLSLQLQQLVTIKLLLMNDITIAILELQVTTHFVTEQVYMIGYLVS